MQRLGELNNKIIVEQKTAPENKYVIWKDPVEGIFKEYNNGAWVKSDVVPIIIVETKKEIIEVSPVNETDTMIFLTLDDYNNIRDKYSNGTIVCLKTIDQYGKPDMSDIISRSGSELYCIRGAKIKTIMAD